MKKRKKALGILAAAALLAILAAYWVSSGPPPPLDVSQGPYGGSVSGLVSWKGLVFASAEEGGLYRNDPYSSNTRQTWQRLRASGDGDGEGESDLDYTFAALASAGDKLFATTSRRQVLSISQSGQMSNPELSLQALGAGAAYGVFSGVQVEDDWYLLGTQRGIYCGTRPSGSESVKWEQVEASAGQVKSIQPIEGGFLAGTSKGIFKGGSDGREWVRVSSEAINALQVLNGDIAVAASERKMLDAGGFSPSCILRSVGQWQGWERIELNAAGDSLEIADIAVLEGDPSLLFAATSQGTYQSRDQGIEWALLDEYPAAHLAIAKSDQGARLYVGGPQGIRRGEIRSAEFKAFNSGLFHAVNAFLVAGPHQVVATPRHVFHREGGCESEWQRLDTGLQGASVRDLKWYRERDDDVLLAATNEGVFRLFNFRGEWQSESYGLKIEGKSEWIKKLALVKNSQGELIQALALVFDKLYRMDRSNRRWSREDSYPSLARDDELIDIISIEQPDEAGQKQGLIVAASKKEVLTKDLADQSGRWVPQGLSEYALEIKAICPAPDGVLAVGSDRTLYRLSFFQELGTIQGGLEVWDGLRNKAIEPESCWVDPTQAKFVMVGSHQGIYWSNDGGQSFHRIEGIDEFEEVTGIHHLRRDGDDASQMKAWFALETNRGLHCLEDNLPRSNPLQVVAEIVVSLPEDTWDYSPPLALIILASLLLMSALSTRVILLLVNLDIRPISWLAPGFYATRFGRWKLLRRYRANLRHRFGEITYMDLPYKWGGEPQVDSLSRRILRASPSEPLALAAAAGSGKTTLCHYLAGQAVSDTSLLLDEKQKTPVIIEGDQFDEDPAAMVRAALGKHVHLPRKKHHMVEILLQQGIFLILFDGYSEIPAGFLQDNKAAKSLRSLADFGDNVVLVTSRPTSPGPDKALGASRLIELNGLAEAQTQRRFLGIYLKEGEAPADRATVNLVHQELKKNRNFPDIPLIYKLAADLYNQRKRVPENLAELFKMYTDEYLLRSEVIGSLSRVGLWFALECLVRESYLESGGERRSVTQDRAIKILGSKKEELGDRAINLPPSEILGLFTQKFSIYRENGKTRRFFHDSFQSFYAACALESDILGERFDLAVKVLANDQLEEVAEFLRDILLNELSKGESELLKGILKIESRAATRAFRRDLLQTAILRRQSKALGLIFEGESLHGKRSLFERIFRAMLKKRRSERDFQEGLTEMSRSVPAIKSIVEDVYGIPNKAKGKDSE